MDSRTLQEIVSALVGTEPPSMPTLPTAWTTRRAPIWELVTDVPADGWLEAGFRRVHNPGRSDVPVRLTRTTRLGDVFVAYTEGQPGWGYRWDLNKALSAATGGHCNPDLAAEWGLPDLPIRFWRDTNFSPWCETFDGLEHWAAWVPAIFCTQTPRFRCVDLHRRPPRPPGASPDVEAAHEAAIDWSRL